MNECDDQAVSFHQEYLFKDLFKERLFHNIDGFEGLNRHVTRNHFLELYSFLQRSRYDLLHSIINDEFIEND